MKLAIYLFITCALLLLLSPHTILAAEKGESIGTVVAVRGEVMAEGEAGAQRRLSLKSPVFRDDTIKTGSGRVQLMFSDNTLISLGRKSEMVVSDYDWQPEGKSGAMKTRIKEGTFRVMGGAITKVAPGNFSTETPAATIGIRGSMYAGKATPDALMVVFQGGKGIDVTNAAGTVAITKPGFGTMVPGLNQRPLPPVRFTADDLEAINEGLQSGTDQASEDQENGGRSGNSEEGDQESKQTDEKGGDDSAEGNTGDDQGGDTETGEDDQGESSEQATQDQEGKAEEQETATGSIPAESETASPENPPAETSSNELSISGDEPLPEPPLESPNEDPFAPSLRRAQMHDIKEDVEEEQKEKEQEEEEEETEEEVVTVIKEALVNDGIVTEEGLEGVSDLETLSAVLVNEGVVEVGTTEETLTTTLVANGTVSTSGTASTTEPVTTEPVLNFSLPLRHIHGVYSLDITSEFDWHSGPGNLNLYDDGTINGSLSDGTALPTITIPNFDPAAIYAGPISLDPIQISITNTLGTFTPTVSLKALQSGEFIYGAFDQDLVTGSGTYEVSGLAFAGISNSVLPTSGIEEYYGQLAHISETTGSHHGGGDLEDFLAEINWHNNALVGRIFNREDGETEDQATTFFFGHVDPDPALSRIVVIDGHRIEPPPEPGSPPEEIEAIKGKTTFGQFYGPGHEGFGFTAEGDSFAVQNGTILDSWQAIGAGFLEIDPEMEFFDTTYSPKFEGFVVGVAEDMAGPSPSTSRLFMNSTPGEFSFVVDQAAGTLSGSLGAYDQNPNSTAESSLQNIDIGGTFSSAYVLDDQFAAILGCGTADCVQNFISPDMVTGGLKPYGNFLITAAPDAQWQVTSGTEAVDCEYLTWGYWELAYKDPDGDATTADADYHLFGERSLWIAGERTPKAAIDDLIGASATGTYTGGAKGFKVASGEQQPVLGKTNLTVDFANTTVEGTISFGSLAEENLTVAASSFDIDGTAPNDNYSFYSNYSYANPDPNDDSAEVTNVRGAFYGPNAEAVGGSFNSEHTTSNGTKIEYLGIFGGVQP